MLIFVQGTFQFILLVLYLVLVIRKALRKLYLNFLTQTINNEQIRMNSNVRPPLANGLGNVMIFTTLRHIQILIPCIRKITE